jgi:hypothetical protein
MDPLVIVDALATVMGHEEKELCKPAKHALNIILSTATLILGSKDLVLPYFMCRNIITRSIYYNLLS